MSFPKIQIYAGDDVPVPVSVVNANGSPVNLSGYAIGANWSPRTTSQVPAYTPLDTSRFDLTKLASGLFTALIPSAITAAAPPDYYLADPISGAGSLSHVVFYWTTPAPQSYRQTMGAVDFQILNGTELLSSPIVSPETITIQMLTQPLVFNITSLQGAAAPSFTRTSQFKRGMEAWQTGSVASLFAYLANPDESDPDYITFRGDEAQLGGQFEQLFTRWRTSQGDLAPAVTLAVVRNLAVSQPI